MKSRNTPPSLPRHPAPVIPPANEVLRRPEPNVIDQRQQQIDPAGHHRSDVNADAAGTMKQPGGTCPQTQGSGPCVPALRAGSQHPLRSAHEVENKRLLL